MLNERNLTIIDVETTGGSPFFSRIIEVGLLRVENGEVVEEFQTLVNPGQEIPEFITQMTGISQGQVDQAPMFAEIADELLAKFAGSVFVAHNANFDYSFIKEEYRRLGYGFIADRLCTVRLSRALYKEHKRHNLTELISRFNFETKNRHRAFDDAKVLWDFLQHIQTEIDSTTIEKALKQVIVKSRLPKQKTINSPVELVYEDDAELSL